MHVGELPPVRGAHVGRLALALAELEQFRHGLAVGLQPGVVLPGIDELRLDLVEESVDRLLPAVLPGRGRLGDQVRDALALQPRVGGGVLAVGKRVEQMAVELRDSRVVEACASSPGSRPCTEGIFRLVAPRRNGWSRSSARLSIRLAASASVRATMMPGTRMMSSWKRAVLRRLICSSDGTSTLPP